MKKLLITFAVLAATSILCAPAQAPTSATPSIALKSCFGRLHLVSVADSLLYCSQTGTIFQDASDLYNRGLLKTVLVSQNF
jgi:hypothetical protein